MSRSDPALRDGKRCVEEGVGGAAELYRFTAWDGCLKRVKGIENAGRRVREVVEMAKLGEFSV